MKRGIRDGLRSAPTTSAACCARRSCARRFARTAAQEIPREFRAAQDEAIREVVQLQQDCGLEVVTDGEFRRISYWEKFVRLTKGLEVKDAVFTFHDAKGRSEFTAPYVSGKVARTEPITVDE